MTRPSGRHAEPTARPVRGKGHRLAIEKFESAPGLRMSSSAFDQLGEIPRRYTADGENLSPPLFWDAPAGTSSFALLCEDPDAPTPRPFVHWVVFGLPMGTSAVMAGMREGMHGLAQGRNSYGHLGYDGPAPPPGDGPHEYHFQIFALDCELTFRDAPDRADLVDVMHGHVIAVGEVVGTYER
jgi:Raf kinase inhibitor-like YbhB/YbcL family protein